MCQQKDNDGSQYYQGREDGFYGELNEKLADDKEYQRGYEKGQEIAEYNYSNKARG